MDIVEMAARDRTCSVQRICRSLLFPAGGRQEAELVRRIVAMRTVDRSVKVQLR